MEELERRLAAAEAMIAKMEGRFSRATRYCRQLEERIEGLEASQEAERAAVHEVATSIRAAGGAFMTIPRRAS